MKKYFLLIALLCLSLVSCNVKTIKEDKPEIETHTETTMTDYKVTKLFTVDGMTVYRFYDQGRYRYFVSNGELIDTTIDEEDDEDTNTINNAALLSSTM